MPYGILMSLGLLMLMCLAFCVLDQKENTPEVPHIGRAQQISSVSGPADVVSPPSNPRPSFRFVYKRGAQGPADRPKLRRGSEKGWTWPDVS